VAETHATKKPAGKGGKSKKSTPSDATPSSENEIPVTLPTPTLTPTYAYN
jgi:hypothetical protein